MRALARVLYRLNPAVDGQRALFRSQQTVENLNVEFSPFFLYHIKLKTTCTKAVCELVCLPENMLTNTRLDLLYTVLVSTGIPVRHFSLCNRGHA